jgi:hypothetical protein
MQRLPIHQEERFTGRLRKDVAFHDRFLPRQKLHFRGGLDGMTMMQALHGRSKLFRAHEQNAVQDGSEEC